MAEQRVPRIFIAEDDESILDLLVTRLGRPQFTWGSTNLVEPAETRRDYVRALQAADGNDIGPLLAFART